MANLVQYGRTTAISRRRAWTNVTKTTKATKIIETTKTTIIKITITEISISKLVCNKLALEAPKNYFHYKKILSKWNF